MLTNNINFSINKFSTIVRQYTPIRVYIVVAEIISLGITGSNTLKGIISVEKVAEFRNEFCYFKLTGFGLDGIYRPINHVNVVENSNESILLSVELEKQQYTDINKIDVLCDSDSTEVSE